jgi:excisionase family DNA binding protein
MQPEWLTVKATAQYCTVSLRTVRSWIAEDGLRSVKVRGTRFVKREWIDAWMLEGEDKGQVDKLVDQVLSEQ